MISQEEARTRVAKGAALLDRVRPNWFSEIDTGRLMLSGCSSCIIGQLFGDYCYIWKLFGAEDASLGRQTHGFTANLESQSADKNARDFQTLQDAWVAAIAERLCKQPQDTNAVDPSAPLTGTLPTRA